MIEKYLFIEKKIKKRINVLSALQIFVFMMDHPFFMTLIHTNTIKKRILGHRLRVSYIGTNNI